MRNSVGFGGRTHGHKRMGWAGTKGAREVRMNAVFWGTMRLYVSAGTAIRAWDPFLTSHCQWSTSKTARLGEENAMSVRGVCICIGTWHLQRTQNRLLTLCLFKYTD